MKISISPKSNYPILEGGNLNYAITSDGCKIRFALWPKGRKGLIVFFNGRNEYLEKYNESYKKFQSLGYAVVALDWRGQGLSDRVKKLEHLGYVGNFSEYQLQQLLKTQRNILFHAQHLVKPGGFLIYSTCSVLPQENHEQISWFLKSALSSKFILASRQITLLSFVNIKGFTSIKFASVFINA